MFKLIFSSLGKYKEIALVFVLAIVVFVWGIKQLGDFLNPAAFNQAIEGKIIQAEGRSKDYIDGKILQGEKLVDAKHQEVMNAIRRLDNSVDNLRAEIREIYRDGRTATISVNKGKNKN